jgi:hypothetical protein
MTPGFPSSRLCAIFDLDGTLADLSHRAHLIQHVDYNANTPRQWEAFYAGMKHDTLIGPMRIVLHSLQMRRTGIVICTGRGEENRDVTEWWLTENNIFPDGLYMRAAGDFRQDVEVKGELADKILADGWLPFVVFEDRSRVVEMWRARGLLCAQVARGDF